MDIYDIAFSGTSLTSGYATRDWKHIALARLQAGSSKQITFYDLGKPGSTSEWGLANIHNVVNTKAKAFIFEWSFNDAGTMTVESSRANALAIINAVRAGSPGTRIIMQTMNPALGDAALLRPQLAAFYQAYRDIAEEHGLTLIDNYLTWGASSMVEIPDGGHPTLEALKRVLIPNVVTTLRPIIAGCKLY